MAIKFGSKQFNKPTPAKLSNAIQVFTVVGSLVLAWIGTAPFISAANSVNIQSILGLLIGIANGLKPFFGVSTTQTDIPIENVTAMEETKKD